MCGDACKKSGVRSNNVIETKPNNTPRPDVQPSKVIHASSISFKIRSQADYFNTSNEGNINCYDKKGTIHEASTDVMNASSSKQPILAIMKEGKRGISETCDIYKHTEGIAPDQINWTGGMAGNVSDRKRRRL